MSDTFATGVATNVPGEAAALGRQRPAWAAGEVRLFLANPQIAIRHPLFSFYGALLVILASPLRWESVFQPGIPLLGVGISYCLLLFYFHFEHRDRYLLLLPFYGLFTSLVMVPLGVFVGTRAWCCETGTSASSAFSAASSDARSGERNVCPSAHASGSRTPRRG